jgi:hypothetical protein
MKKLLVLFVSTVLVLSLAVVTLAKVEMSSDLRFELYQTSNAEGNASTSDNCDFRLNFDGQLSDVYGAHLTMRMIENNANDNKGENDLFGDEYYFTAKYKYATLKLGYYEYIVHPSRQIAKACDTDTSTGAMLVQKNQSMLTAKIPIHGNLYGGFATIMDVRGSYYSEDAYDFDLGYTGNKWGTVVHYFQNKADKTYLILDKQVTYDIYYDWKPNFRIYAFGICPEYGVKDHGKYKDEAVLGLQFNNVLKTKLFAAFEYGVLGRTVTTAKTSKGVITYTETEWERAPYGILLKYPLGPNYSLELEHTNINATNDVKNLLRLKVLY